MCGSKILCVFLDFGDARGLGLLFMTCACAVGLREHRFTSMRGTWGVVWWTAHVPTISFTWLRRANAWTPLRMRSTTRLFSLKLCQTCRFNYLCASVLYCMGSREFYDQIWAMWRHISHMGEMHDSDWSRQILLRSDWSGPSVATITTSAAFKIC